MVFFAQEMQASHFMGADLTYECLGNDQYVVSLTLYRDCGGSGVGGTASVAANSMSCGETSVFTLPQISTQEVSQLCTSDIPNSECNSSSSSAYPGVESYLYRDTVTLPDQCTDWVLSWNSCCRNADITNLQSPSGASLYVEATLNNANGFCNSSPYFTTRPIPYICAGHPYSFNHGAIDPDGDTLIYELVNPLDGAGTLISYNSGLDPIYPLVTLPVNDFNFNVNTGQMFFTPDGAQTAVVAVRIYEIRNGDTIGTVMRDIQMVILSNSLSCGPLNTPNNPIIFGNGSFDTTSLSFVVCAGDQLQFTLDISDSNGDSISLDMGNTNLEQVFGLGNYILIVQPQGQDSTAYDSVTLAVVINAVPSQIGVNAFTLGFTDNACPIPSTPTYGFNLIIPGVEGLVGDTTICPGIAQSVNLYARSYASSAGSVGGAYQWTQLSGPSAPLTSDTIQSPIAQVPGTTVDGDVLVFLVQFDTDPDPITNTICSTFDTIRIKIEELPLDVQVLASNTFLCPNGLPDTVDFTTSVTGSGVDLVNGVYTWTSDPINYLSDLSANNINSPFAVLTGVSGDSLNYSVRYTYGACAGEDTVTLHFDSRIQLNLATDTTVCAGDSAILVATYISPVSQSSDVCGLASESQFCTSGGAIVQVGTGVNSFPSSYTSPTPYQGFWHDGRMQILFHASELDAMGLVSGLITSLAFDVIQTNSGNPYNNFSIKMGCTDEIELTSSNVWLPTDEVFTGTVTPVVGWNTYNFTVPYKWDGVSNIVIEICFDNTAWSRGDPVNFTNTSFSSVFYDYADGATGCSMPASNFIRTSRPNIQLGNCQIPLPVSYQWTPSNGFSMGGDTLGTTGLFVFDTTFYTVEATDGNCALKDSMLVNIIPTITKPNVTCGALSSPNNITNVLFEWGGAPTADLWKYSLDTGRTWMDAVYADSSLLVTNVLNGDCVQLLVRGVNTIVTCPNGLIDTFICCTSPCTNPVVVTTDSIRDLSCNNYGDGIIGLSAIGGLVGAPYTFSIFDTNNIYIDSFVSVSGTIYLDSIPGNGYYVQVFDDANCMTLSDTLYIDDPDRLAASIVDRTYTSCHDTQDGGISITATGGVLPYTFNWDTGTVVQMIDTLVLSNISSGVYNLVVMDVNACTDTLPHAVVPSHFGSPPLVDVDIIDAVSCPGDGIARISGLYNLSGYIEPGSSESLLYTWSTGSTEVLEIENLDPGIYYLTVTDTNSCMAIDTFLIEGPLVYINGFNTVDPDCNTNNGFAEVRPFGGTVPYSYEWSSGDIEMEAENLNGGYYRVTVTDANGCTTTGSVVLAGGDIDIEVVDLNNILVCKGDMTGFIDLFTTTTAPVAPSYIWSHGDSTEDVSDLPAGTYSVTATIESGGQTCSVVYGPIQVFDPSEELFADILINQYLDCTEEPIGILAGIYSGGWGNYEVNWSSGASDSIISNLSGGLYTLTITDGMGCEQTQTLNLQQPFTPDLDAWVDVSGIEDGTVFLDNTVLLSAGFDQTGVNYQWTTSSGAPDVLDASSPLTSITGDIVGVFSYYVTASSTVGDSTCTIVDSVSLWVYDFNFGGFPTAFTPNGDDLNDLFRPINTVGVDVLTFQIFDRSGQLVYDDPGSYQTGWDGTYNGQEQSQDIYVYVFVYEIPATGEQITVRGEVSLIR